MEHKETTEAKEPKRLTFDLSEIADVFQLVKQGSCEHLTEWLDADGTLAADELSLFDSIYADIVEDGDYWNEEELKMQAVAFLMHLAHLKEKGLIKIFYERPLSAVLNGYRLSVVTDCMVAAPRPFNSPRNPYFFLQEFKRGKGEKTDPEAQMLVAMLIAQHSNADQKPLYGGYLVGSTWVFTTLYERNYCVSRKFDLLDRTDLLQVVFMLRKLKTLILNGLKKQ